MARTRTERRPDWSREIGVALGEALGEGLAVGLKRAMAGLEGELVPLSSTVLEALQAEVREAVAQAESEPEIPSLRPCQTPGCSRKAVARGMCRRHYARQVYQERKARLGLPPPVPRRTESPSEEEGEGVALEKKNVVPVAPIVRRKKNEGESEAPAAAAQAATKPAAAQPNVSVDSVARFFGLKQ